MQVEVYSLLIWKLWSFLWTYWNGWQFWRYNKTWRTYKWVRITEGGGGGRYKYFTSFLEYLKVHLKLKTIDFMGDLLMCLYRESNVNLCCVNQCWNFSSFSSPSFLPLYYFNSSSSYRDNLHYLMLFLICAVIKITFSRIFNHCIVFYEYWK